ncbi:MAG: flagellar biosynthetic protein FliO [Treponema sp.]|nr:flagellar biosynthetic protein FliO [Treponema sp.]
MPCLGSQEAAGGAGNSGFPDSAEREILLGENVPGISIPEPGPVSGFVIFRTILLLVVTAAAIYGVVYAVKKFSQPRDLLNPSLRILASVRLGPGRFVHVVALGTRAWLVGAGEGGISLVADITEQEALDTLFLEESRRNGASVRTGDFRSLLRRLGVMRQEPAEFPPAEGGREAQDDLVQDNLVERIRRRGDRLRGL